MLRILFSAFVFSFLLVSASAQSDDAGVLSSIMMKTWDRPDARLTVNPVVIEGDAAVAGWTQEDRGGRALFRKRAGTWTMILCAGAALRDEKGLVTAGLPQDLARKLSAAVVKAESALPKSAVQAFDSFEGTVMMGEGGHEPGHQDHSSPSGHRSH